MSVRAEHREKLLAALNLLTEDVKKGRVNLEYKVELVFEDGDVTISYKPESPVSGIRVEYRE
jgi:hypothetical protein